MSDVFISELVVIPSRYVWVIKRVENFCRRTFFRFHTILFFGLFLIYHLCYGEWNNRRERLESAAETLRGWKRCDCLFCVCDALKLHSGNLSWRTEIVWMEMKNGKPSSHRFLRSYYQMTQGHIYWYFYTHIRQNITQTYWELIQLLTFSPFSQY